MNKFKAGDIVMLKKKVVKDFYNTEALLEMYDIGNNMYWESKTFCDFVNGYTGFVNGEKCGIVIAVNNGTLKVQYNGVLGWDFSYYGYDELKLIKRTPYDTENQSIHL